jgi:predicted nucleotidyltransferase component of viral defense system
MEIVGLVLFANYDSLITKKEEQIKIEISFRNKLIMPTSKQVIHHEFVDALGKAILPKNKTITCISLIENFAEKYRALFTRPVIAIRDLYDIYYILVNKSIKLDFEFKNLVLLKLNETMNLTLLDLDQLITNLKLESLNLNSKELEVVLKQGLFYDLKAIINKIIITWFDDKTKI